MQSANLQNMRPNVCMINELHACTLLFCLQQMTRSQQMDELLDVLIESGGEYTRKNVQK